MEWDKKFTNWCRCDWTSPHCHWYQRFSKRPRQCSGKDQHIRLGTLHRRTQDVWICCRKTRQAHTFYWPVNHQEDWLHHWESWDCHRLLFSRVFLNHVLVVHEVQLWIKKGVLNSSIIHGPQKTFHHFYKLTIEFDQGEHQQSPPHPGFQNITTTALPYKTAKLHKTQRW